MASAKDLLSQGDLKGAIEQIISEVKARPTDTAARTFLFGLLCFAGELDRAEKQLDVIATQSAQSEIGVIAYRNCLKAERERRRLWSAGTQPHFLMEPPAYIDMNLEAIKSAALGDFTAASDLLGQAEELRPALPGTCDGVEFYDLRDADDFIAPVLEVAIKDQYAWIPFEQIRSLEISKPEHLRDLLYTPVRLETTNGTVGQFFLLSLYPGSSEATDDLTKLGRRTEWQPLGETLARGAGLKMLMIGDEDKSILEVQQIEFAAAAETLTETEE